MADEPANSTISETIDENPNSVNATIESSLDFGGTESTCNFNAESSCAVSSKEEREKSLEYAEELTVRGSKAASERDYVEATDCYSRALEIKVAHYGELAPECVTAYYKYGCALLYKAQDEADPLAYMPKKEGASGEDAEKDGSVKSPVNVDAESPAVSVSNKAEHDGNVNRSHEEENSGKGKDDEGESESDGEDPTDGDEDESDLDLAWKMLDVARAVVEKQPGDTLEKVDILSALAEVALEREDVETSLSDYLKALSLLQRLVEPDSRLIAELDKNRNFRVCLCLEMGSKPEEAIPYCQTALSTCKSRVQRLTDAVKKLAETASESDQAVPQSSTTSQSDDPIADKEAEIETLNVLCSDLEKKLEDLHQLVSNPPSLVKDILGIMSARAKAIEQNAPSPAMSSSQIGAATTNGGNSNSPTVSTAHTNGSSGVTHLGVVGRGVKRVATGSVSDSSPAKKPATVLPQNNGEGGSSC